MNFTLKTLTAVASGSIAASMAFSGVAQAQVNANASFGGSIIGGVTFDGALGSVNSLNFASQSGVILQLSDDYTPFNGSTAPNDFANDNGGGSAVSGDILGLGNLFGLSLTTLDFSSLPDDGSDVYFPLSNFLTWSTGTTPANRFTFRANSARIAAQSNSNLNIVFGGIFSDSQTGANSYADSLSSVSLSITASGLNAGAATLTFGTPPEVPVPEEVLPVPEPTTTIFGLLVVGAAGLASRPRKS
ncbi:PEP-CTERM sorting domain-containing protein [Crocosphaera sp. XPORK-15E]|uniref:PEP-CTERM sorting domain-containing protein n=1 Tax=Crocosphaera sp. XPORK-15E TaxID=3110247 RepID=UPI002B201CE3|nr:PEP-CTERM sorting domain-containing protein [Crocosphaera sp. XPORK-15E]MEA5533273.1 PEP-CTERM sorting domain-containing protein [Crocosphaera sp. XPORK-15E]